MSDEEEYATTSIDISKPEKPKRERTEAQKQATAKALEALRRSRAEKAEAKKAVVKRTTRTTTTVMKPAPRAPKNELMLERASHYIPEEEDEEAHPYKPAPRPSKAKPVASPITHKGTHHPPPPSYDDDIRYLKEGLMGLTGYLEEKENRKAQRKARRAPVESESESSSSEDEAPAPRRKKMPSKKAPPTNQYNSAPDPQEVLRSIFWR